MSDNLTCSGKSAASVITASVKALAEFKNSYVPADKAVTSGGNNTADGDVGYIRLNATNSTTISVKSWNKDPCNTADNRQENSVSLD